MATGDVFSVAIAGTYDGQPIQMSIGLKEVGGGGSGDAMVDVALAVNAALGGGTATLVGLSHNVSISSLIVTDVSPGLRPRKVIAIGPHVGAGGGAGIPSLCAAVVSWATDLRGPKNRGRIFVPGVPAGNENLGTIDATGITNLTTLANLLFTPFVTVATAYRLSVLSYVPGTSPKVLRAAVPITSFVIGPNIKSQRRRGVGVRIGRRPHV